MHPSAPLACSRACLTHSLLVVLSHSWSFTLQTSLLCLQRNAAAINSLASTSWPLMNEWQIIGRKQPLCLQPLLLSMAHTCELARGLRAHSALRADPSMRACSESGMQASAMQSGLGWALIRVALVRLLRGFLATHPPRSPSHSLGTAAPRSARMRLRPGLEGSSAWSRPRTRAMPVSHGSAGRARSTRGRRSTQSGPRQHGSTPAAAAACQPCSHADARGDDQNRKNFRNEFLRQPSLQLS
jgi:hypothetical protein